MSLMHSPLRNLIFDIDGTLMDSRRDIANAQLYVLRKIGVNHVTAEDIYPLIGKPLAEIFATLLPSDLHHHIPKAKETYVTYYRAHALDTTDLFPGVRTTLEQLHAKGIRLAVATTKSTATSARVLGHFGVAQYFAHIQGSDDIPYKPDPTIIQKICREQDWQREETMMVGDSVVDVEAGKRAQVRTCGVTWGALDRDQMVRLEPDHCIDRIEELLGIVG